MLPPGYTYFLLLFGKVLKMKRELKIEKWASITYLTYVKWLVTDTDLLYPYIPEKKYVWSRTINFLNLF